MPGLVLQSQLISMKGGVTVQENVWGVTVDYSGIYYANHTIQSYLLTKGGVTVLENVSGVTVDHSGIY